jgi:hypothetical protein
MSPRALLGLLAGYTLLLALACVGLRAAVSLDPQHAPLATRIVTDWRDGRAIARTLSAGPPSASAAPCGPGCTRTIDRVIDEGPLPSFSPLWFALSIVAGRDGIAASYAGRTFYLTPDDLLARQATRDGVHVGRLGLRIGLDAPEALLDEIATALHTDRDQLRARGRLRRILVRRENAPVAAWPQSSGEPIDPAALSGALKAAADYLVRNQRADGSFYYELAALSASELPGYGWPRHGGAALTLAQVAARTGDPAIREAALRAARLLQHSATLACGAWRCIGDGERVDAGSSALALLTYCELARSKITQEFALDIRQLSGFLRSLQRRDGEFMHVYDRALQKAVDVQLPYYTGEIALALGRAERLTHEPADLRAASAGLARLVRRSLFQNRYYFSTEHWTCQVLQELWDRAPDRAALDFCLDDQAFNSQAESRGADLREFAGGIAPNPFAPPRMAATGSRTEGAVATLATALAAGRSENEIAVLDAQVRRALAFMLRFQLRPGPRHLLRDPARMVGAMPGSPTDLTIRIDYQQHVAGSMLRYLQLLETGRLAR